MGQPAGSRTAIVSNSFYEVGADETRWKDNLVSERNQSAEYFSFHYPVSKRYDGTIPLKKVRVWGIRQGTDTAAIVPDKIEYRIGGFYSGVGISDTAIGARDTQVFGATLTSKIHIGIAEDNLEKHLEELRWLMEMARMKLWRKVGNAIQPYTIGDRVRVGGGGAVTSAATDNTYFHMELPTTALIDPDSRANIRLVSRSHGSGETSSPWILFDQKNLALGSGRIVGIRNNAGGMYFDTITNAGATTSVNLAILTGNTLALAGCLVLGQNAAASNGSYVQYGGSSSTFPTNGSNRLQWSSTLGFLYWSHNNASYNPRELVSCQLSNVRGSVPVAKINELGLGTIHFGAISPSATNEFLGYDGTDTVFRTVTAAMIGKGAFTAGSVIFVGPSVLAEDNTNFFWDDTNDRLKVKGIQYLATSPAQITADQNDYSPGSGTFLRLYSDAVRTLTGIASGADGRRIKIANVGAFSILLANQNASSVAGNRIITGTGGSFTILPDTVVNLTYDSTTSRWRLE